MAKHKPSTIDGFIKKKKKKKGTIEGSFVTSIGTNYSYAILAEKTVIYMNCDENTKSTKRSTESLTFTAI